MLHSTIGKKSAISQKTIDHIGACQSLCLLHNVFNTSSTALYKKPVKRQFDIFVWVCSCRACMFMCFSPSIVPFKEDYGGWTTGRVIQFIKKNNPSVSLISLCTAVHKNAAFILACTIMTSKALIFQCGFHLPVGMLSSHTLTDTHSFLLIASLPLFPLLFFFNH